MLNLNVPSRLVNFKTEYESLTISEYFQYLRYFPFTFIYGNIMEILS